MSKTWICTASGKRFYSLAPRAEDVDPYDIGFALGNICRYTGHVPFYSVAEHCVHVCDLLRDWQPQNYQLQLGGLLHDASEAYIADVSRPLKHSGELGRYLTIEAEIERVIERAFSLNLTSGERGLIKKADLIMFATEVRDLMSNADDIGWEMYKYPPPRGIVLRRFAFTPTEAQKLWWDRLQFIQECMTQGETNGNF